MTTLALTGFTPTIAIFGCGTMAGAMLRRWLAVGLDPARVTAIRQSGTPVAPGVATRKTARGLTPPDILLVGVKPQQWPQLASTIAPLAGPHTLLLSIMAGIGADALAEACPDAGAVVRLMPNLPVAEGQGVVARFGEATVHATALDALLAPLGLVQPTQDERQFDLVTALAGCGPAFTYRFAAALAAAGERLGLAAADAELLARATVIGAASAMRHADAPLSSLAAAVASPGGMTQAGLDVLDADGVLMQLLTDTLRAARDRGAELAALAHD